MKIITGSITFTFLLLILVLTNCTFMERETSDKVELQSVLPTNTKTPIPTVEPTVAATPSPLPTSTLMPSPTPTIANNPLPEFPLTVGNTWVYSATYHGFTRLAPIEPLTATYIFTDKVVATKTYASLFGAAIERTSSLIEGTPLDEFHDFYNDEGFENPQPRSYAYVISGTQVYLHDDLSFLTESKQKAARAYRFPLVYEFPLVNGNEFRCWYSWLSEGGDCQTIQSCDYYYYVKDELIDLQLPAGNFDSCYTISVASCSAEDNLWFCPNVGIMGKHFLYKGQGADLYPTVSYEIKLISHTMVGN